MADEVAQLVGESSAQTNSNPETKVRHFIQTVLVSILDELSKTDGRPTVTIARRSTGAMHFLNQETGALESRRREPVLCSYSWPGSTVQEAWRFGVILRILSAISDGIHGGVVSSKRDIFYQDPLFFGSQEIVDHCIDDIACTIGVDRRALHVTAAAKGLTAGSYGIVQKDGSVVDVGAHPEGIIVPRVEDITEVALTDIKWVMVIEKEAVFHRLATSNFHDTSSTGKGILITGKGYPDLCTRAFLRLLSRTAPIRIYALVDADPDGLAIMSTYKYGSVAQLHENANLNVRRIEWLGLCTSELLLEAENLSDSSLMPLSLRDRKKAMAMLARSPVFAEDGPEATWRDELQRMLVINSKAEIEFLYELRGGLEGWLDRKLVEMA